MSNVRQTRGGLTVRGGVTAPRSGASSSRGRGKASGSGNPLPYPLKFTFKDDNEQKLYESLIKRDVYNPRIINWEYWTGKKDEGEECATKFVARIEELELEHWADEHISAYRGLMLEFFTTVDVKIDGSLEHRFHDVQYTTTKSQLRRIFLFYDGEERNQPEGEYDEQDWWYEMAGYRKTTTTRHESSKIKSHSHALAYKFLCQSFLGNDDFSRMSKTELGVLWKAKKGGHVDLIMLLAERIKSVQKISNSRTASLILGAFVTKLARFHRVRPKPGDVEFAPVMMVMHERTFRGVIVTIPTFKWVAPDPENPRILPEIFPDEEAHEGDYESDEKHIPTTRTRRFIRRNYRQGGSSIPAAQPQPEPSQPAPFQAPTAPWTPTHEQWSLLMANMSSMMESNASIMANQEIMMASDMAMSLRLAAVEDDIYDMREDLRYMRWGPPEHEEQQPEQVPEQQPEQVPEQQQDDVMDDA